MQPGRPLPWEKGHPLQRTRLPEGRRWRHTLYGGVFALDRVHAALVTTFGADGPDVDERVPRGEGALFAVAVTADGRLLLDSLVLSTAAWVVGRTADPGPDADDWLDGFALTSAAFAEGVRDRLSNAADEEVAALAEDGTAVTGPVSGDVLTSIVNSAVSRLGVAEILRPFGIRVLSEAVGAKRALDPQVDFLNSFFAEDLDRVAGAVWAGDYGPALAAYLSEDFDGVGGTRAGREGRLDVRGGREDVLSAQLAPRMVPLGRWPADPEHSLATSQQRAVNLVFDRLGDGGLFGVNGPPGTGKTTMLRDMIAGVVTERACRLADLPTPDAAFETRAVGWRSGRFQRRVRPLRQDFTGFEMVVASSNNGAVANVTREIPLQKAIHESWWPSASYLAEHATRALGEPAWGLVAAVLGRKSLRGEFVSRFWYGQSDQPTETGERPPGFLDWLKAAEAAGPPAGGWPAAVNAFRAALAAEQRLRSARQAAHDALQRLPELRGTLMGAQRDEAAAGERLRLADEADDATRGAAERADSALAEVRERRREHLAAKPGTVEMLLTFGGAIRRWHREDEPLAEEVTRAQSRCRAATAAADTTAQTAATAREDTDDARARRLDVSRRLDLARAVVDRIRNEWPDRVPDTDWQADGRRRELHAPFLDREWNIARTRVFLAALDLHTAFLTGAAPIMRSNLHAAMDVLDGSAPKDAPAGAVLAAWQSLFLVVPVVSTTFASVDRLLGPLGREALGWLFVDEAGQAAPQVAAGAVWRCRRVVAVGDPLQLEPVVTVPHTTQHKLAVHHRVDRVWLPGSTSVQALADKVTPVGTVLPRPGGEDVWVGSPLVVHRRCEQPMFGIVNDVVYGGLMVDDVRPDAAFRAPDSSWLHVPGGSGEDNWIPEEGQAAMTLLERLVDEHGVSPRDVLMVSPFRSTARNLARITAARFDGLTCGTVHVAQGREADVVILVLGGTAPGARAWAAQRPNMLNVAVSRTRRRLYVVGNHEHWSRLPYYSSLSPPLHVVT